MEPGQQKTLSRLVAVLAATVADSRKITPAAASSDSDLSSSLDCCSSALLELEIFLAPAYIRPTSGVQISLEQCSAIARFLAQKSTAPVHSLAQHLVASLDLLGYSVFGKNSNSNTCSICTILSRLLLITHFTLQNLPLNGSPGRREYVKILHTCSFLETCVGILSGCTNRFQVLSPASPEFLTNNNDRLKVRLCGAVLACTLGHFCHAAYGDVRASSEVIEEIGGHNDPRPSKNAVWTSLLAPACRDLLPKLTVMLTNESSSGTFFQQQDPVYRSLITPGLGLHYLVRVVVDSTCISVFVCPG